jgi:hypothetical protein
LCFAQSGIGAFFPKWQIPNFSGNIVRTNFFVLAMGLKNNYNLRRDVNKFASQIYTSQPRDFAEAKFYVAERARFELAIPFGISALQADALDQLCDLSL